MNRRGFLMGISAAVLAASRAAMMAASGEGGGAAPLFPSSRAEIWRGGVAGDFGRVSSGIGDDVGAGGAAACSARRSTGVSPTAASTPAS